MGGLGVSDLMLKIKYVFHGYRPIIYISYTYNIWKVVYFIATEDSGIIKAIIYFIMFPFSLLLILFPLLSYLDI